MYIRIYTYHVPYTRIRDQVRHGMHVRMYRIRTYVTGCMLAESSLFVVLIKCSNSEQQMRCVQISVYYFLVNLKIIRQILLFFENL